ncbi:hypothetical protein H5410_040553 [Solanum commersonii]|uniref:Uncharacterized protein n=1 Tax=Solanum commersonii TaxID=4109 RepID=A0A9J5XR82_SOLCO|nr:hypothetical protein H5410_040553 [Solanum commersonii]
MVSDSMQKLNGTIEEDAANVDGSVPKRPHLEEKANGLGIFLVFLFLLELTLVTVYIALVSCIVIFVQLFLAIEEAQHLKKLIQDFIASFIKIGDKMNPDRSWMYNRNNHGRAVQSLSIFNQPGKGSKKRTLHKLTEKEKKSAELHVLLNCPEVQPFLDYFVSQYGHDQVFPSFITWYTNWVSVVIYTPIKRLVYSSFY